ncbi:MAG TPA: hypothetical protein VMW08_00880 [Acidimicrobiales bacterium]|nr:hypothetical protein [Acidimicrobiales bacterium]
MGTNAFNGQGDPFGSGSVVIPDVPTPLVAYRQWQVQWGQIPVEASGAFPFPVGGDSRLQSTYNHGVWEPGREARAGCPWSDGDHHPQVVENGMIRFPFGVPARYTYPDRDVCRACPSPTAAGHEGYGCGIYGFKLPGKLAAESPLISRAWGRIEMWGTVYDHDYGYRGSHARVTGIGLPLAFADRNGWELAMVGSRSSQRHMLDYLAALSFLAQIYRVPLLRPRSAVSVEEVYRMALAGRETPVVVDEEVDPIHYARELMANGYEPDLGARARKHREVMELTAVQSMSGEANMRRLIEMLHLDPADFGLEDDDGE